MFFADSREHFFTPLTGKYRAVVAECLRLLYQRLYTDLRDYGIALGREQLLDIFKEAIARAPVLDDADESDGEGRFKNQRELAGFIVNRLLEHGWLEKQVDEASLQSSYGFTRMGRLFTQPFADSQRNEFRTRNRNTRNTRNSLQAFYDRGEVHDLLDAYEYSERIISDFTDVIADLEERKRQLVREVESRQLVQQATDEFFDFMDKVFKPDLEVRLSADSVEKYRDQIADLVTRIRRKRKYGQGDPETADKDWRAVMELRLRQLLPQRVVPGSSLLEGLLQTIEARLKNACETMLPALRRALNTFTQRADIIIRQLTYIHSQGNDDIAGLCQQLSGLERAQQDTVLDAHADALSGVHLGLIDPGQIQLRERRGKRQVRVNVDDDPALDPEAQKQLFIQQALDQAFSVQGSGVRQYIHAALAERGSISSRQLRAESAQELLCLARAIEVGALENLSSRFRFHIHQPEGILHASPAVRDGPYFSARDDYRIELIEDAHEQSDA
ncbi:Wadjet anti-phage system protein JetA family protein [Marinimicrobium alkaliphilum]|uniref:Wadjet anti-phage system protein JetA family protein n=1 Tax=Marinimicrobium alkaliphilum TaxID=2202654 RepID=UPI000DBA6C77|nr:Wadjet anti-phage system protein JetA family protein [Marinimicrobium alkaliphilum]